MPHPGRNPSALAVDSGFLWVADYQTHLLYKLQLPDQTPYVEDQERRVHVSFEVTYRVKGRGKLRQLVAYVAVPREIPGQHILSELKYDPAPTRFETDKWDQKLAVFEIGELGPGDTRRVRWEADFAVFRTRFQLVPETVDTGRFPAGLEAYLGDGTKYDLTSPAITELVDKVIAGKKGTYDRARAIYEHLAKSITYDRSGGWNNAAAVLKRGTGSCSEYTFTLVGMLRKAGIPARYVGAISERGDEASFDDVFHRWAEAYMPGYGWVPLDANAAHGARPGERGHFFGGRSNRHIVTTIGAGDSDQLEWTYNNNEKYVAEGEAMLEALPLGRYTPLSGGPPVTPHKASAVIAPVLVRGPEPSPNMPRESSRLADPWVAAIAVMMAMGLGIGIGRLTRPNRGSRSAPGATGV